MPLFSKIIVLSPKQDLLNTNYCRSTYIINNILENFPFRYVTASVRTGSEYRKNTIDAIWQHEIAGFFFFFNVFYFHELKISHFCPATSLIIIIIVKKIYPCPCPPPGARVQLDTRDCGRGGQLLLLGLHHHPGARGLHGQWGLRKSVSQDSRFYSRFKICQLCPLLGKDVHIDIRQICPLTKNEDIHITFPI